MRSTIFKTTKIFYEQKIVPLWAIANEEVILNASLGRKQIWSNKSKRIYQFICSFRSLHLSGIVIFASGFIKIVQYYIKLFRNKADYKKAENVIFVGHGANAEFFIYEKLSEKYPCLLKTNIITLEGFNAIEFPSFFRILFSLLKNTIGLSKNILKLCNQNSFYAHDFLTAAALNIGEYVFFREVFRLSKNHKIKKVIFLAMHVSAYSCIDEKIDVEYHSHGLIKLSILFPKPNQFYSFSLDEINYFKKMYHGKIECHHLKNDNEITKKKNVVIIVSPEIILTLSDTNKENFLAMLTWLKINNIEIIFRVSPTIPKKAYENISLFIENHGVIDNSKENFESFIKKISPKFVIGFNSTCLLEALNMDVIPVSLYDLSYANKYLNMIYPFSIRTLFWPRDEIKIKSIFISDNLYEKTILKLREMKDEEIEMV